MTISDSVQEQAGLRANIRVAEYRITALKRVARTHCWDWADLSDRERYRVARFATPTRESAASNTTTVGFSEWIVDGLDASQDSPPPIDGLAVGSGTGTVAESDRSMFTPEGVSDVAVTRDDGDTVFTATFIDTTEFNEVTITEVGLRAGDDADGYDAKLLNHANGFNSIEKTNSRTVTIEATLTLSAV